MEKLYIQKGERCGKGWKYHVCNMGIACRLYISINKLGDGDQFNNMKLVYLNISDKIYLRNIIAIKASYVGSGQLMGSPYYGSNRASYCDCS